MSNIENIYCNLLQHSTQEVQLIRPHDVQGSVTHCFLSRVLSQLLLVYYYSQIPIIQTGPESGPKVVWIIEKFG